MNRSFFVVFFFILLCGCTRDVILSSSGISSPLNTKGVSYNDSYRVSLDNVNSFVCALKRTKPLEIVPISKDDDTLLFICNMKQGWLVISGDKRATPVLAESDEGYFDVESAPQGIKIWLDALAEDMWLFKTHSPVINNDNTAIWGLWGQTHKESTQTKGSSSMKWYAINTFNYQTTTGTTVIPHLILTKWGQDSPWNTKCPIDTKEGHRCYLGCSPTAIAQLLYYTHYNLYKPCRLYHTISCSKTTVYGATYNIGFSRSSLYESSTRWNSMAIDSTGSNTGISYVGDFILDIGNRLNTKYSGKGSSADIGSYAMSHYYDLSYSESSYNEATVLSNLNNSKPVLVKAYSELGFLGIGYTRGHEWLIDGLYRSTTIYNYTKRFEYSENWPNYDEVYDSFSEIQAVYGIHDPEETIDFETYGTASYWLMNWGYDGHYDSGHYSVGPSSEWNANGGSHLYNRTIYYDFH